MDREFIRYEMVEDGIAAITLSRPVPIYIEYVTVDVADDGSIRFFRDVYGRGYVASAAPSKGPPRNSRATRNSGAAPGPR